MGYLKFEKDKLVNLEYSLNREILRSNRAGSYALTTISGCNTRKYHGLLVAPLKQFDGDQFVLLSGLDETIIQRNAKFNLGIHKYKGDMYVPKGHKYIRDFNLDYIPKIIYRVGGVVLEKERVLVEKEQQLLIKYTLLEAVSPTKIKIQPLLAFRNIHELTKANMSADTKVRHVDNGVASKLYAGFPSLYMQLSKQNDYVHFPDWYYDIEYLQEKERGYPYKEDLFVPGYFEFSIKKGESIVFSASTKKVTTSSLKRKFTSEVNKRADKYNFKNCLGNAAEQFFFHNEKNVEIISGFPWLPIDLRTTFISLSGLTIATDRCDKCRQVLDTQIKRLKNGLFPSGEIEDVPSYNSSDTSLWFIYTLQQLYHNNGDVESLWKNYGKSIKSIIKAYTEGTENILMDDDGLIKTTLKGIPFTWMNAMVNGKCITERPGKAVEVNALWYNSVLFALELAKKVNDHVFVKKYEKLPERIKQSFNNIFWNEEKGYLADFVDEGFTSWKIRPNQIIATSLPYSPIEPAQANSVIRRVEKDLLTSRGLRSLSPKDPDYKGIYFGSQEERDLTYHQGTVWPWLLEHYSRAYLKVYKESGIQHLKDLLDNFESTLQEHAVGTISEIYDGDPPHTPRGAISFSSSVGALLAIIKMVDEFKIK